MHKANPTPPAVIAVPMTAKGAVVDAVAVPMTAVCAVVDAVAVPEGVTAPVAAVVVPLEMDREAEGKSGRPTPPDDEVLKWLEGRRSSFGLALGCCCASPGLDDRIRSLQRSCERVNLPVGDGAGGSVYLTRPLNDRGMFCIAELIARGAFPCVTSLNLQNQVGYHLDGQQTSTVELPRSPAYGEHCFGPVGFQALMTAIRLGPGMPALLSMNLSMNRLGDAGMEALSAALASGKLPKVAEIRMYRNNIGDKGVRALARACATPDALPALSNVYLGMTPSELKSVTPEAKAALQSAGCTVTEESSVDKGAFGSRTVHLAATGGVIMVARLNELQRQGGMM